MKKSYVFFILIAFTILIAILTNPNQERHKEVIKNKLTVYFQKSISENSTKGANDNWKNAGQALGTVFGSFIINQIVDNLISTNNYVLFSTTNITWEGETKIIGIGAFGNVFITDKLDKALNKGLLNPQNTK